MSSAVTSPPWQDDLNSAQREAVLHGTESGDEGPVRPAPPLLIIAGAGTGKTNTLAHRVAHLVVNGADPRRILLLTFSRRAAQEMTRRTERIVQGALRSESKAGAGEFLQSGIKLPWSGTFHSVANRLLRIHAEQVGLAGNFTVLDRGDAADLLDLARHEQGLSAKARRFPKKDTCLAIYSRVVNSQEPLAQCLDRDWPWCRDWEAELKALFKGYVELKQAGNLLDYDDLLLYWFHLMQEPALAKSVSERFDHVLVDEYQDTNALQANILLALKPDGAGVTVVGDDAQSIYAFRAARVENILDFPTLFSPPARTVTLEQNYRATQALLDSANAVIALAKRQYRKELRATRGQGARPCYVTVPDQQDQAEYVVTQVLAQREAGVALRRQVVLFRNAHHSDQLELELIRRKIPYVKYGGLKFLEAAHVKDLLAALRWLDNPRNQVAAFRVLQLLPGVGPATARSAFDYLAAHNFVLADLRGFVPPQAAREAFAELANLTTALGDPAAPWQGQLARVNAWYRPHLERIYDSVPARQGDLEQLEQIAGRYAAREQFLTDLALDPPQASSDWSGAPLIDEDYLILSTIHSAKGQEWDSVYLLNVSDGTFPSEFATGSEAQIEEERRLLYVAMTRARDSLHLISPLKYYVTEQARYGDRHVYGARSRFLPDNVMERFDQQVYPREEAGNATSATQNGAGARIDIGARLRDMW